jgi:hypothetical protein
LGASAQKRAAAVPGKKPIERTLPLKEIDYHFCVAVEASHNAEVHNLQNLPIKKNAQMSLESSRVSAKGFFLQLDCLVFDIRYKYFWLSALHTFTRVQ